MTSPPEPAAPGAQRVLRRTVRALETLVYILFLALALRILLFQPFTIPSASMEPTLRQGDYVIVAKYAYGYSRYAFPLGLPLFAGRVFFHAPARGDIVVFKLPRDGRTDYIKRVIGLPGDRVQVRAGVVYVDEAPLARTPAPPQAAPTSAPAVRYVEVLPNGRRYFTGSFGDDGEADNTGVYLVPPHCYFVLGDNRDDSADSRYDPGMTANGPPPRCPWDSSLDHFVEGVGVGFVPEENLIGRARLVLLSWNPQASLIKPWTWLLDARPERFFMRLA